MSNPTQQQPYQIDPRGNYKCPYCNETGRLVDAGMVVDAYKNVCHVKCLDKVRSTLPQEPATAPLSQRHNINCWIHNGKSCNCGYSDPPMLPVEPSSQPRCGACKQIPCMGNGDECDCICHAPATLSVVLSAEEVNRIIMQVGTKHNGELNELGSRLSRQCGQETADKP